MSDALVSYSSKDRVERDLLIELLTYRGLSVWIDWQGIVGIEKWATKIVQEVKGCSAPVLLLLIEK
jgi:uncharacterized phage-like protein YoqJ